MDFTKVCAEIRNGMDDETVAKVGSTLKDLERAALDLLADAKSDSAESKSRRLEIKKLEDEKVKLQDEVDSLKADDSSAKIIKERDTLKSENEKLTEYKTSVLKSRRDTFVAKYDKIKDNVNFEKVSKGLKIAEEKDGKRDWSGITDDDIDSNLSELQKAEDWGLFEKAGKTGEPNPNTRGNSATGAMFKEGDFSE